MIKRWYRNYHVNPVVRGLAATSAIIGSLVIAAYAFTLSVVYLGEGITIALLVISIFSFVAFCFIMSDIETHDHHNRNNPNKNE